MTRAETLRALADRCEAAPGPDRELERAVTDALLGPAGLGVFRWVPCIGSLDAAVALTERLLPVSSVDLTIAKGRNRAQVHWWPAGILGVKATYAESEAATPALALVAATLRALAEKESTDA